MRRIDLIYRDGLRQRNGRKATFTWNSVCAGRHTMPHLIPQQAYEKNTILKGKKHTPLCLSFTLTNYTTIFVTSDV